MLVLLALCWHLTQELVRSLIIIIPKVVLLKNFTMRITPSISVLSVSASLSSAHGMNVSHPVAQATNEPTTLPETLSTTYAASFNATNSIPHNSTTGSNATTTDRVNRFKLISNRIRDFFKSWRRPAAEKPEADQPSPAFVQRR